MFKNQLSLCKKIETYLVEENLLTLNFEKLTISNFWEDKIKIIEKECI